MIWTERLRAFFSGTGLPKTSLSRRETALLALGALLALLAHARYSLTGFGEQDAARLAMDAVHWHAERVIYMADVDYRLRTSPLYIHLLKLALDRGLSIRALPGLMNGASVIFSSACLVGFYLLFRRFSGGRIAAAATVVYALTPCFWLGSVYGMPTLLALTFWIFATLAFSRAVDEFDQSKARAWPYFGVTLLFSFLAFALKADLVLSAGAFAAVLLVNQRMRLVLMSAAVGIVLLAFGASVAYANSLAAAAQASARPEDSKELGSFLRNWDSRFPFRWEFLVDPKNNNAITHAVSGVLVVLVVLAVVHGLLAGGQRTRLALGMAAWGLPAILFWGLKSGNSARHNLPAFPGLVLLAIGLLFVLVDHNLRKAWVLIGVLAAFALLDETGSGSVAPKINPFTASRQVESSSNSLHSRAAEFVARPNPKKAVIETNYLLAYSEFEVWAAAKSPRSKPGNPRTVLDGNRETRIYEVGAVRQARALAQDLQQRGWDVFSAQFQL
ncbi:MAG TPA: glycosyltransferase family 39 protein [Polyangiaceae bacterium]|jgi:hypothetical protein|nr:glycosyltransferase family 39 protein [Polyangiaceae bacterium]